VDCQQGEHNSFRHARPTWPSKTAILEVTVVLPNFLIAGAQKAGTSWLREKLRQHPAVFMPRGEIHYFDRSTNYALGIDWYSSHFSAVTTETAIGEKSPEYMWANGSGRDSHLPNVHRNIHSALPDVKLIFSLRNPVERAISAVNHHIRRGRVHPFCPIDQLLLGSKKHLLEGRGILQKGYYAQLLEAFFELFDRQQVLILIFEEDIVQDPALGLRKACRFLDVDPSFEFTALDQRNNRYRASTLRLLVNYYLPSLSERFRRIDHHFPQRKPSRPSEGTIRALYDLYAPENERLFSLLGRRIPS